MINIFIFRCTDPKTSDYYYYHYFADRTTRNNSPNCPYKKLSCLRLVERTFIFKKQLSVATFVSTCILDQAYLSPLKLLLWWSITRKCLLRAIFMKGSFSLFFFSLKWFVGSERKHTSRHRLLDIIIIVIWILPNIYDAKFMLYLPSFNRK